MSNENLTESVFAQEFHIPAILKFTFPTIFMMVFMGFYTITDTIFVSRLVGTDALAAMNIVCPAVNLMVGLGTMLAAGGNAVISRKIGEGKRKEARDDFTFLVVCGAIVGTGLAILGLVLIDQIIRGLGASETLYGYCREYLATLLLFFPAGMLQTLFANLFVTAGRPGLGSALSVAAGMANIVLDYFFMKICGFGIRGAAIGTGCGYLIPAAAGIVFFLRDKGCLRFSRLEWKAGVLAESCFNGCSELVSQMSSAVTTFLFNRVMLRLLGEDGVAAITVMIYLQFFLSAAYMGFSMGIAPIVGYTYGAGDRKKLFRLLKRGSRIVLVSSVFLFILTYLGSPWLVELFSGGGEMTDASMAYMIAREGFPIFSAAFLFCGTNIFLSAMFTAMSDGKTSVILSFLRTFGFLASAILVLPEFWGVDGVWMAVPVAEGAAAAAGICVFHVKRKNMQRNFLV